MQTARVSSSKVAGQYSINCHLVKLIAIYIQIKT